MSRYAAFLRGMNLGNRRITNDELAAHLEELGFTDVGTFLASGNVVFETDATDSETVRSRIEEGLEAALDYRVPTFLRTGEALREIAAFRPFPEDPIEGSRGKLQVALLRETPTPEERKTVLDLETEDDRLVFDGQELYWLPENGVSGTGLGWRRIDEVLGTTTVRTRRTIERIVAKFF
ncbi:MAG: DUF1697 domain-containing protein [Thermoanaerobaculia bacterium]|nr:DUF1697 domain-containing protein [Thermoanaerobaculia bacterium]